MSTEYKKKLEELIQIVLTEDASDLHLAEERVPIVRVSGFLIPLVKEAVSSKAEINGILSEILDDKKIAILMDKKDVDFAFDHAGKARFRGNAYFQLGKLSIALRLIPKQIKSLEELGLPSILGSFAAKQQGFFLVVGPSGQGKSTTLASLIEIINVNRLEHIVTLEDPIEYIFQPKKAIIEQREILQDTPDFHTGLKGMLRQDVDVMMIGEMRTPEDISAAVTAAETGHLVFSTLHTNTASQTMARIIDSFGADQQNQIRSQLASSLLGIFSQKLIPRISGGLIPACEFLINNNAVANLIRENRIHEIDTIIETSSELGMIDLNRYLSELVRSGEITIENAYLHTTNAKTLERMI